MYMFLSLALPVAKFQTLARPDIIVIWNLGAGFLHAPSQWALQVLFPKSTTIMTTGDAGVSSPPLGNEAHPIGFFFGQIRDDALVLIHITI
jgi:hypothetical protein